MAIRAVMIEKEVNNMNYLKHSLLNITKLIVDAIKKGNVECYEDIHTSILTDNYIIDTIYEKDEVGVYIAEEWDWFGNGEDEYYDGYTYLYTKGLSDTDLQTIKTGINQMLKG